MEHADVLVSRYGTPDAKGFEIYEDHSLGSLVAEKYVPVGRDPPYTMWTSQFRGVHESAAPAFANALERALKSESNGEPILHVVWPAPGDSIDEMAFYEARGYDRIEPGERPDIGPLKTVRVAKRF